MNTVENFFNGDFELLFNERINRDEIDEDFKETVTRYIEDVCNVSIEEILDYIENKVKNEAIEIEDVFQFSQISDFSFNLCTVLNKNGNREVTFLDTGKLLHKEGMKETVFAQKKYGENHLKAGELIGLVQYRGRKKGSKTYSLSGIGVIFGDLNSDIQRKFLTRLFLRNKVISRLYRESKKGNFYLDTVLYNVTGDTYIRRKSSIKSVLNYMLASKEYDFSSMISKILYRDTNRGE